jgi:nucleotide-binding universal stress UspA family protein
MMAGPKRILVATDFSEQAAKAFDAALALAVRSKAELHVIHALEVALPLFEPYAVVIPADWVGEARRLAQEKLAKVLEAVEKKGLTGTTHLGDVPAAHAVTECARKLGADLVVVGTHGHTGLKHVLLGSVAERTVEYAPCSVWTVKGARPALELRTVVVGTDLSPGGGEAVATAAAWARDAGAKLHVVHALQLPMPLVAPYEVAIPEGVIEGARREAQRQLDQLAKSLSGVQVSTELATTPAHAALVDAAERLSAELIVTGSRGHTGLKHALLGSVAERTLRYAPCSVLTVRKAHG